MLCSHQNMKTSQKLPIRRPPKSRLIELPREILVDDILMKRLPVKSVFCLRCVCRTLRYMVDSNSQPSHETIPSFLKETTMSQLIPKKGNHVIFHLVVEHAYLITNTGRRLRKTYFRGELEAIDYDDSQCKFTVLLESSFCFPIKFDHVHCRFGNLFCCSRDYSNKEVFLINPFRRQFLKLPPTEEEMNFYGMGFDDKTKTYKIVGVKTGRHAEAQVLALDGGSWKEVKKIKFLENSVVFKWTGAVSAYGGMHWLCSKIHDPRKKHYPRFDQLVSFDFNTEKFKRTALPKSIEPIDCRLVTLRESIAIVDIGLSHITIWVMKNYHTKEWEKAHIFDMEVSIGFGQNKQLVEYYGLRKKHLICNEWEHGIFLSSKDEDTDILLFLDVDNLSVRIVPCPSNNKGRFFSVKRSLLSTEDIETNSNHSRKRSRAVYGEVRSSVKTRKTGGTQLFL